MMTGNKNSKAVAKRLLM